MLFKNAVHIAFFPVSIRNESFTLTVNPICTCNFICNCMFELLYYNQFSSFIVQLRSVLTAFYRINEWMSEWIKAHKSLCWPSYLFAGRYIQHEYESCLEADMLPSNRRLLIRTYVASALLALSADTSI